MRRTSPRPDHSLRQLSERLDAAARRINPFLAAIVVILMLLSFARAVSLIDWRVLPQTPAATACPSAATAPGAINPGASPSAATASRHLAAAAD
ncbi:MAG: hypothetical protein ACREE9_03625 [Stellaceae bacterium]